MALGALVAPMPPPAGAAAPSYVALGDSYSSGVGTRSYLDDGTSCRRSAYAFPSLIAAARGFALTFRACSGATIPDVTSGQLGALDAATAYVTISVGGNDAGFAAVLTECAQPWWMSDCDDAVETARAYIRTELPAALATLYAAIRARASSARVVAVGYPRIFDGEDCNAATWFSPTEEKRLNATADLLDSTIAAAAAAQGFAFADPTDRFTGHAVCDDTEWLNGLSYPITESYHPDRAGHRYGYTPLVGRLLTGATVRVGAATLRAAADSAPALAEAARRYAGPDAAVAPERFVAPDPTGARARVAARRAGVDLDRWLARAAGGRR
nr:SGNH/GDSL hydrolase family protein [Nocardioides panaciterrulae]